VRRLGHPGITPNSPGDLVAASASGSLTKRSLGGRREMSALAVLDDP
jgi:hypothetical protein